MWRETVKQPEEVYRMHYAVEGLLLDSDRVAGQGREGLEEFQGCLLEVHHRRLMFAFG